MLEITFICRYVVSLIVKTELTNIDIDLSNDEDVNRYYNYICNGIDTLHTVQIQDNVIEKILLLVPYYLRVRFTYYTESLLIEIKDIYSRNIKKAILQYALQDSVENFLFEVQLKFQLYFLYVIYLFYKNIYLFSKGKMMESCFT